MVMLMEKVRVLGRKTSNNVQKVLWLLEELGLPFQQEDYGGPFGKTKTPDYLKRNPNGTVPTLIDGDLAVWESNTILRYLANRAAADAIYPAAAAARSQVERWMDWQIGTLSPAFRPLFIGLVRDRRPLADLQEARDANAPLFKLLDGTLASQAFLAGNQLSLADIAIGPMVYRWYTLGLAQDDTPHLRAWFDGLCARPGYRAHVMIALA